VSVSLKHPFHPSSISIPKHVDRSPQHLLQTQQSLNLRHQSAANRKWPTSEVAEVSSRAVPPPRRSGLRRPDANAAPAA
jgi:hypothetical protein